MVFTRDNKCVFSTSHSWYQEQLKGSITISQSVSQPFNGKLAIYYLIFISFLAGNTHTHTQKREGTFWLALAFGSKKIIML